MASKTWQVSADVLFPNDFSVDVVEGEPQVPQVGEQLVPRSRIPTQHRQIDEADVFICEADKKRVSGLEQDLRWAVALLTVRLLDLTGKPKVGDTREFWQWSGFATPTFSTHFSRDRGRRRPSGGRIGGALPRPCLGEPLVPDAGRPSDSRLGD